MTKWLKGSELRGYLMERQARQVRNLRQEHKIFPKLLIIMSENASDAIRTYVRMKQRYAADILIDVEVAELPQTDIAERIRQANDDESIQGIIVQLPLQNPAQTDEICDLIAPEKDVDGLGKFARFPSATAQAIDWLLAGYCVDLDDKKIAIVGQGKLVGAPLTHMWRERKLAVTTFDETTSLDDLAQFDVIVTATGVPRLITSEKVKRGAVVVDAGTASESGKLIGDVADDVRLRDDLTITPEKGGVGPLTYVVLFDRLVEVCLRLAGKL